jgi:hypothetical protein
LAPLKNGLPLLGDKKSLQFPYTPVVTIYKHSSPEQLKFKELNSNGNSTEPIKIQ